MICHGLDDDTGNDNRKIIKEMELESVCTFRENAKLMHNKFMVLCHDGQPVSTWTGSTNLSRNGLFGHLNVGHVVHDAALSTAFLAYWKQLATDPENKQLKQWNDDNNALPPADDSAKLVPFFSPRKGRKMLDWWIKLAQTPKPLFMTFPFGIAKDFRPVFDKNDGILRFALLDKYTNGGNPAAAIADIERIRRFPNIGMALGNHIFVDWLDGWHKENDGIGTYVNWVHTKFMLIDPLGPHPHTLTGSANFSLPSVDGNDENMVLIRDNQRVADIYFTEFMRLFAHHRFRESVKRHIKQFGSAAFHTWRPQFLFTDPAKWVNAHFVAGSEYDIKRRYFVGA